MKVRRILKSNIGNHQNYPDRNIKFLNIKFCVPEPDYFSESSYTSIFLTNHNTSNYLVFTLNVLKYLRCIRAYERSKRI